MRYLFSAGGLQVVESLTFTRTLYAFDFDGTIAAIVKSPELAKATAETERQLNRLAKLAPVVLISGRSVADLRSRISLPGNRLIGNHGLEGLGVRKGTIEKANSVCREWIRQLESSWEGLKRDPGIFVEDKTYSLALHYRHSRSKQRSRMELFSRLGKLQPAPRLILGKCVMNLLPAGGPHKGVALLEAMMKLKLSCALYIGDDDTDEDVFSLPDDRIISVRVGQKKRSQAQYFIRRQGEINRLLRLLVRLHETRG